MDTWNHLILLAVCVMQISISRAGRIGVCSFPKMWHGRWYRNALGNMGFVNFKQSSIDNIGDCVATKNDDRYFLMHDSEEFCYKCILIIKRADNVIQYRQSFCDDEGNDPPNMEYICGQIKVESPLITLVRVGASPIPCPLGRDRALSYDNNTGQFCSNSRSHFQTCASNTKMRLQFGACDGQPETRNAEIHAECLADWKDGSHRFIYTSILSPEKAIIYRCFKYELHGPQILVQMSTDASCRTHMKINLEEDNVLDSSCLFPAWIQGARWMDFTGKAIYNVHSDGQELYANRLKDSQDTGRTTHRFSCLTTEANRSELVYMSVSSVHKCSTSFQCLKLQKNTAGVIQITESTKSKTVINDCTSYLSQRKHIHNEAILVRDTAEEDCPIRGQFRTGDCTEYPGYHPMTSLHLGCRERSVVYAYSQNEGERQSHSYRCLKHWRNDGNQFILARDQKTNAFVCLVHGNIGGVERLITNDNCMTTHGQICTVEESRDTCLGRHRVTTSNRGDPGYREHGSGNTMDIKNWADGENSAVIMYSCRVQCVLHVLIVILTFQASSSLGVLVC